MNNINWIELINDLIIAQAVYAKEGKPLIAHKDYINGTKSMLIFYHGKQEDFIKSLKKIVKKNEM